MVSRKLLAGLTSAIILLSGIGIGYVVTHSSSSLPRNTSSVNLTANISIYSDATYLNLKYAYGQVWDSSPPQNALMTMAQENNVTPLLQFATNSTGKAVVPIPAYFTNNSRSWSDYFASQGLAGSSTSLQILITYVFTWNASFDKEIFYSNMLPYTPEPNLYNLVMNIDLAPDLSGFPSVFVKSTNISSSNLKAYSSLDPSNGETRWVQIKSTQFSNTEIPVAFGNLTGGNNALVADFSLGTASASVGFDAAEGYNISSSNSFDISTNPSYTSANDFTNRQMYIYSPSQIKTSSSGYIYLNGTLSINRYQEQVYQCFYSIYGEICMWVNESNYETIMAISAIDASNGIFESGVVHDAYDPYSPYTSPQAISALKWDQALISKYKADVPSNGSVQWGSIYSSVSGNYNNIQGGINGVIGMGLAVIGVITAYEAATGWSPASGWGDVALTILAVTGLVSSIVALFASGVIDVGSSTSIMTGSFGNMYQVGNNPANNMNMTIYAIDSSIGYNGNSYTFPIMDVYVNPS